MSPSAAESPLPLYVLTGFLGSGKTSLLRHCLQSDDFADTAVVVNEFGEIGLDHELVETSDEETVVLKGGCICCTVREDLAATIRRLADLRRAGHIKPFSRLVIETSGLADPVPVLVTLKSDPRITQMFEFRGAIVAVDAVAGSDTLSAYAESVRQVIYANRAVITKCDLAAPGSIGQVKSAVRRLNGSLSILHSDSAGIPPRELLDGLSDDPLPEKAVEMPDGSSGSVIPLEDPQTDLSGDSHADRFRSFSWEFDEALDWTAFGVWLTLLLHVHGARILRVKGILNISGTQAPVAVHGVQHMVYPPRHMAKGRTGRAPSRLVFVLDGVSPALIRRSFEAFHALGSRISAADHRPELPQGRGRIVAGWPRRRPRAAAWTKG